MTEYILVINALCLILGVLIGHKVTMSAFAHVQPSTKDLISKQKELNTITTEEDPWDYSSEDAEDPVKAKFKDTLQHLEETTGIKINNPNDFVGFNSATPTQEGEDEKS